MNSRVQLTLDRALSEAERLRNLRQLEALMMPHDEDDALAVRQTPDLALEYLSELPGIRAVLRPRCFLGGVLQPLLSFLAERRDVRGMLPPTMIDAGVH